MIPARLSTGFPGLDQLLEGVHAGDNVVFHARSEKLYRPFVQALITHCRQTNQHLAYIRQDTNLDDLFGDFPGTHRFDCTTLIHGEGKEDNPHTLIDSLKTFLLTQGKGAHFIALNLTGLSPFWDRSTAIQHFYQEVCPLLFELHTLAYWLVVKGCLPDKTVAIIRDTAQVFLDLEGEPDSPVIHIRKALGRYSKNMAWPHKLDLQTGEAVPLSEGRPTNLQVLHDLEFKVRELQRLRTQCTSALCLEKIITDFSQSEVARIPFQCLMEHTVTQLSNTLEAPFTHFFEFPDDGHDHQICAGTGWHPESIKQAMSDSIGESHRWVSLISADPLIADHIASDARFAGIPLFSTHGVTTGVCVSIMGNDHPLALLGVYRSDQRTWAPEEIQFLRTLSNLIGIAMTRRRAETQSQRSFRHLQEIINLSDDALISLDESHHVTLFNPAAERIFGYTVEERRGKTINDLLPDRFSELHRQHLRNFALSPDQTRSMEGRRTIYGKRKDGTEFPCKASIAKFTVDGQQTLTVRLRDISQEVQMEEHLRQTESQLRQVQKMEAIGTLAGGIAHDFNNILTAMLGNLELAGRTLPKEEKAQKYLNNIKQAGTRAKELVRQILTFSRKHNQPRQLFSLSALLQETISLLKETISSSVELRFQQDTSLDFVFGDPTQIEQVLINLATNADHAMRKMSGVLDIRLSSREVTTDTLPLTVPPLTPGLYYVLTVKDTGHGMPSHVLERIFEPFFTTKDVGEGSGMGLSVIHGILASHHGGISVETILGQGTTFKVYLPQTTAIPKSEKSPLTERSRAIPQGHERLLLVEDETSIAFLFQDLLKTAGYHVVVKTSSLEALATFQSNPKGFDLVITDQTMPHLTGDALAKHLLELRPDLPIILCSGYSYAINAEKAKALGIRAYLLKPFGGYELTSTIRGILDRPRNSP